MEVEEFAKNVIRDIPEDTLTFLLLTAYHLDLTNNLDVRAEWNSEDHSAAIPILTNDETEAQERRVPATNCKLMVEPALKPGPPKFQNNLLSTSES